MKTDLQGLKKIAETHGSSESPPKQWNYSTVWLPVQTEGKAVVNVITRQEYMDKQLKDWRLIQITRVGAIILGIGALFFLVSNILVSVVLGLGAGWFWGNYVKTAFFFEHVNRKREILEGT